MEDNSGSQSNDYLINMNEGGENSESINGNQRQYESENVNLNESDNVKVNVNENSNENINKSENTSERINENVNVNGNVLVQENHEVSNMIEEEKVEIKTESDEPTKLQVEQIDWSNSSLSEKLTYLFKYYLFIIVNFFNLVGMKIFKRALIKDDQLISKYKKLVLQNENIFKEPIKKTANFWLKANLYVLPFVGCLIYSICGCCKGTIKGLQKYEDEAEKRVWIIKTYENGWLTKTRRENEGSPCLTCFCQMVVALVALNLLICALLLGLGLSGLLFSPCLILCIALATYVILLTIVFIFFGYALFDLLLFMIVSFFGLCCLVPITLISALFSVGWIFVKPVELIMRK